MTNPISKISDGLLSSILHLITSKEGLSILCIVITIFILILWLTNVINKNGGYITFISFLISCFMCWIAWAHCNCS
jgi:hypothetical protein